MLFQIRAISSSFPPGHSLNRLCRLSLVTLPMPSTPRPPCDCLASPSAPPAYPSPRPSLPQGSTAGGWRGLGGRAPKGWVWASSAALCMGMSHETGGVGTGFQQHLQVDKDCLLDAAYEGCPERVRTKTTEVRSE